MDSITCPNVLHALLVRVRTSVRYYVICILCTRAKPQKPDTRHHYLRTTFLRDTSARGYVPDPPSLFSHTGGSGNETMCILHTILYYSNSLIIVHAWISLVPRPSSAREERGRVWNITPGGSVPKECCAQVIMTRNLAFVVSRAYKECKLRRILLKCARARPVHAARLGTFWCPLGIVV